MNPHTWSNETYKRIIGATNVRIEAGIIEDNSPIPVPDGIINVGTESRTDFMKRIARAKLVLGVGMPHESPTPMEGLCAGTPFINMELDKGWYQHPMLGHESPPFVYNVPSKDEKALMKAIKSVLQSPLDRPFTPEEATKRSFQARLRHLITDDWEARWVQAKLNS